MKIILYTPDIMKIGGIETSFFNLAKYLSEKGYEVSVTYSFCDHMRLKKYQDAGIDIHQSKTEVCDILIVGSIRMKPNNIVAKVVVQQAHADWSDKFWNGGWSALRNIKKSDKNTDIYAAVSQSSANFIQKVTNKPVIVMNNIAPEPIKMLKKKHEKVVFGAFTRMTAEKGLQNYIDFRKKIIELGIDAEFRVYTTGATPKGWTSFAPVIDIRNEFLDINYVVSLADAESFGYTIAEANSCGISCIIKRTNSTGEFFEDKSNVIIDNIDEITHESFIKRKVIYDLNRSTRMSVDNALENIKEILSQRCIIKSVKRFKDLQSNCDRQIGELFAVNIDRAEELLQNELKLVERIK